MTKSEILALEAGRETDALIAEHVMGFQWWRSNFSGLRALFLEASKPDWFTELASGAEGLARDWDCGIPKYSTDLNACHEMEAEIERRGRGLYYYGRLMAVLGPDKWGFAKIHADALTRCKAALLTVMEQSNA